MFRAEQSLASAQIAQSAEMEGKPKGEVLRTLGIPEVAVGCVKRTRADAPGVRQGAVRQREYA